MNEWKKTLTNPVLTRRKKDRIFAKIAFNDEKTFEIWCKCAQTHKIRKKVLVMYQYKYIIMLETNYYIVILSIKTIKIMNYFVKND